MIHASRYSFKLVYLINFRGVSNQMFDLYLIPVFDTNDTVGTLKARIQFGDNSDLYIDDIVYSDSFFSWNSMLLPVPIFSGQGSVVGD